MKSVLVFGVGQLGSRHLQGLKKCKIPLDIYIFDISRVALLQAKKRYEAVDAEANHNLEIVSDFSDIPEVIDVVIIATDSNSRRETLEKILKNRNVKFLILEKILFNKLSDYEGILSLPSLKDVNAYVNCPRRLYSGYKKLKHSLNGKSICLHVTGGEWGLACNLIHFIDLMEYFTGETNYKLNTDFLDRSLVDSKRKEYKELTGEISVAFMDGSYGNFISKRNSGTSSLITLQAEGRNYVIDEGRQFIMSQFDSKDKNFRLQEFPIPFQSEITGPLVEKLINTGKCDLPPLDLSLKLHKTMLISIYKFLKLEIDWDKEYVPFT